MDTKEGHLEIINASKIYDPEGVNVLAVDNCNFEIRAGEFVAIVGPSGCGKTTLLNMTAGFEDISRGEIRMDGQVIAGPGRTARPGPDRVVVFQAGALFDWMTVRQNIMFGPLSTGAMNEAQAKARAMELIRALINEPRILLMDEPFRGLDAMTRGMMQEYFLRVFESTRISMLLITSELDEAVFMGDVLYLLSTMPTAIKKEMRVDLPRPRLVEHQTCPEFAEIQGEAFEVLESEALKSFEHVPGGR